MKQKASTAVGQHKSVAVLIPYYRNELSPDETISLNHLRHFLGAYDRYLISPKSLRNTLPDFKVKTFNDDYFLSVLAYNKLMLAPHFYESFLEYKYVLIYQLDALVFSDELRDWCDTDLDYVGAPWLRNVAVPEEGFSNVGNGGFSLRKVESILKVLSTKKVVTDAEAYWEEFCRNHSRVSQVLNVHKKYLKRLAMFSDVKWYSKHPHDMEDIFWANIAPKVCPEFRIATVQEALRFSFESAPQYCFEENNRQLPFGCHAWSRNDREFWEPYLLGHKAESQSAKSFRIRA